MMDHTEAGPARIMRHTDGVWHPVGAPLPPYEDDGLHSTQLREGALSWWVFPATSDVQTGDVLIAREQTLRLLDRCGPAHAAVSQLARYVCANYEPGWAGEWLAGRQVWSVRCINPATIA